VRGLLRALQHRAAAAKREKRVAGEGKGREGHKGVTNVFANLQIEQRRLSTPTCFPTQSHALKPWHHAWGCLRGLTGALCVLLVVFGLSGPPLIHLALLLLLLVATRSQTGVCVLTVAAAAGVGALYSQGLRVVVRADGAGRFGVALIR
jgi:hypothetical protein